ncbi:MAG: hypothetical protein ACYCUM_09610 [Solirubrobacteraceae bacterium]
MEPVIENPGYRLAPGQTVHDVLALEAELLASEGIDPAWPPFGEAAEPPAREHS